MKHLSKTFYFFVTFVTFVVIFFFLAMGKGVAALAGAAALPPPMAIASIDWTNLVIGGLIGAAAIWGFTYFMPAKNTVIDVDEQPLRVKVVEAMEKKFVTRDHCKLGMDDVQRRLDGHDAELDNLWTVLRSENVTIRAEINDRFQEISRSLGRIEGKLEK
jgi:hypothetical protein